MSFKQQILEGLSTLPGVTLRRYYKVESGTLIVHFGSDDPASLKIVCQGCLYANCVLQIQTDHPAWSGPKSDFYYTLSVQDENLDLMAGFLARRTP